MSNLFDIKMVFTQIPDLLTYLPVTLELAVVAMIVSLILGLILALIKMKKIPVLKQIANLYISVIRGTPVLVQLYVTYFGIPMILKAINLKYGTNYNANGVAPIMTTTLPLKDGEDIEYITTPELIEEKFGKEVELIIDGGIGNIEPSTIVNCTSGEAEIVRQGKGILNDF